MNIPVSHPIAKLLKEKGFEVKVRPRYYFDKSIQTGSYMYKANGVLELCTMPEVGLKNGWIDSPTIADVVMWLYEKYGIWIGIGKIDGFQSLFFYTITGSKGFNKGFSITVEEWDDDKCDEMGYNNKYKESPTKAYESAFEYTLNKLI
jgi:hypothetical protein